MAVGLRSSLMKGIIFINFFNILQIKCQTILQFQTVSDPKNAFKPYTNQKGNSVSFWLMRFFPQKSGTFILISNSSWFNFPGFSKILSGIPMRLTELIVIVKFTKIV